MKHTPKKRNHNKKLDTATARMIRAGRGVSKEIADRTGYSKGHVSDMVNGRRVPSLELPLGGEGPGGEGVRAVKPETTRPYRQRRSLARSEAQIARGPRASAQ